MESTNIFMSYLRMTQHMSQQFRTHFGRLELTFPQALVLTVLGDEGPVPISTLAERTGSANSTVSGVVDRLEKLDWPSGSAAQDGPAGDLRLGHREVPAAAPEGGDRCERVFQQHPRADEPGGAGAGGCRAEEAGRGAPQAEERGPIGGQGGECK